MGDERPRLLIGVPSLDGKVSGALADYLTGLHVCSLTGQFPYAVETFRAEGVAPVHYARNVIVARALNVGASKLLMIDADMIPNATCTRCFGVQADVVTPRMYRFKQHGINGSAWGPAEIATCATVLQGSERFDMVPSFEDDSVRWADGCGTGFVLIDRKVLEDPRMRVGPDDDDGVPALFRMQYASSGRITEWEDIDFSLRAKALGHTVAVDFGAHCGHRKSINLDAVAELLHSKGKTPQAEPAVVGTLK